MRAHHNCVLVRLEAPSAAEKERVGRAALTAAHPSTQAAAALVWRCPELRVVVKTHRDADLWHLSDPEKYLKQKL